MSVQAPPYWFVFSYPVREYVELVNAAVIGTDASPTSWYRTPARNAAVGGDPFSQHLVGLGSDWVSRRPSELVRRFRAVGLIAVDELDHVHAQGWPAGTLQRLARR